MAHGHLDLSKPSMYSPGEYMSDGDPILTADAERITMSMDQTDLRFVAGDKFFNYQQYGALRDGGEVTLFSRGYYGILIASIQSSMTYSFVRYCVRPTLMNFLQLQRVESSVVIECLISLPTSFAIFCGLLSDVLPIAGSRRNAYMIVGSVISFVMLLGLTILAGTVNPETTNEEARSEYVIYYMLLIMGSMFGTLFSKIATDARVIELSQREPLVNRGHIQINYLIFRGIMEGIASWATTFLIAYDGETHNYHLQVDMVYMFLFLTVLAILPVPFVLRNSTEPSVRQFEANPLQTFAGSMPSAPVTISGNHHPNNNHSNKPMGTASVRLRAFFRMCQQRAVWQVVLFLCLVLFTTRFKFGSAETQLSALIQFDRAASQRTGSIRMMVTIAVMIAWKIWLVNTSWRRSMLGGLSILVVAETVRALIVIYVESTRTQLFYDLMGCVMAISGGVISIFSFIPATEIAENGSEGATIGLLQSFRSCIAVATRTISDQTMNSIVTVSAGDTGLMTTLLLIEYAIHALSFLSVLLLPSQKLDAQQLRVYGGYSKIACGVLMVIFLAFFSYSTTVNLDAMVDMAQGV